MKVAVVAVVLFGFTGRCQYLPIPSAEPEAPSSYPQPGIPDAGESPLDAALPEPDAGSALQPDAAAAASDAGDAGEAEPCQGPPGLYTGKDCTQLAQGVESYMPRFELWADGATKERFIYLPAGTQIDTSNPDRWTFPSGTRVYKTFSVNGVKLETRMLEKVGEAAADESWQFTAWLWSADQRTVEAAPAAGASNVLGTEHDVPSQAQCHTCHAQAGLDSVNGFGAIQLNHERAGLNLAGLLAEKRLVNKAGAAPNVDVSRAQLPGDAVAQAAIGYLHANCANCHGGPAPRAGLNLSAVVGMASVADAPAYAASCACLRRWTGRKAADGGAFDLRILPGEAAHSGVIGRMSVRRAGEQMPPIGTEIVDAHGVATVGAWIDSLDAAACQASAPVCPQPLAAAVGAAGAAAGAPGIIGSATAGAGGAGGGAPGIIASASAGAPAMAGSPAP